VEAKASNEREITIDWATAAEINNRLFELERSTNGTDFAKIYETNGQGTTTTKTVYTYVDRDLKINQNTIYYRLQQIDFDGKRSASKVVVVHLKNNEIAINFDAFSQTLALQNIDFQNDKLYTLTIYNLFGQAIYQLENIGENSIQINGFEQTKGLYIYEISDKTAVLATGKMMLTF